MDKRDWYFEQVVTEGQMDEAFDRVEAGINVTMTDPDLVGVMVGGDLAPASPENLTVILDTPLIAYNDQGQRIFVASEDPIDISVDSNAVSTDVAGGGNEKIVSVFIEFDVELSDPEQDGNAQQVFTSITEDYVITVVQGAESAAPATPPALQAGKLLLGDITRTFGQTQIFLADIDLSRQETVFKLSTANFDIDAGTIVEAAQGMLQVIEDHISNIANAHPADAITFDPSSTEHVSTDVQGAIEECGVLAGDNSWSGTNTFTGPAVFDGVVGNKLRIQHHTGVAAWELGTIETQVAYTNSGAVPGGGGDIEVAVLTDVSAPSENQILVPNNSIFVTEICAQISDSTAITNVNAIRFDTVWRRTGGNITLAADNSGNGLNYVAGDAYAQVSVSGGELVIAFGGNLAIAGTTLRYTYNVRAWTLVAS